MRNMLGVFAGHKSAMAAMRWLLRDVKQHASITKKKENMNSSSSYPRRPRARTCRALELACSWMPSSMCRRCRRNESPGRNEFGAAMRPGLGLGCTFKQTATGTSRGRLRPRFQRGAGALYVGTGAFTNSYRERLVALAARRQAVEEFLGCEREGK
jgi:hypothetical protein